MSPAHASRDVTDTVARPVAPRRRWQPAVATATLVCAASMLVLGAWAFLAPASFAQFIDYPPYNRHLIHDAGAFQLGIGTAALLALWWRDALPVALTGFAVASGLHTLSHAIDRRLGGHPSDVPALGLLTVVALFAIAAHLRGRKP
jgi:hypothetical protein